MQGELHRQKRQIPDKTLYSQTEYLESKFLMQMKHKAGKWNRERIDGYLSWQLFQHTFEQAHKKFEKDIEEFFDENGI